MICFSTQTWGDLIVPVQNVTLFPLLCCPFLNWGRISKLQMC